MDPQKYRVTLSDGRQFDVTTEGGPPSEEEVMAMLAQQPEEPRQKGLVQKGWEAATTPLVNLRGEEGSAIRQATEQFAKEHPIIGGGANFAADILSSMSSPLNFALPAVGGLEVGAARVGLPAIARAAKLARIGTSVGMGVEGLQNVAQGYQAGSPVQGISGGLEALGGLIGLRGGRIRPRPTITPEAPIAPEVTAPIAEAPVPVKPPVNPQVAARAAVEPGQYRLPFVEEIPQGQRNLFGGPPVEPVGVEAPVVPAKPATLPIQPPVNKAVAEPIATGKPTPIEPAPLHPLVTPDEIVKAKNSGVITQEQSVKLMEKYYTEQIAKGKKELPTAKQILEEPVKAEKPITEAEAASLAPEKPAVVEAPKPIVEAPKAEVIPIKAVERLRALGYDEATIDTMDVNRAKEILRGKVKAPAPTAEYPVVETPVSSPEMAKIRALGYTNEQIFAMKPEEARALVEQYNKRFPKEILVKEAAPKPEAPSSLFEGLTNSEADELSTILESRAVGRGATTNEARALELASKVKNQDLVPPDLRKPIQVKAPVVEEAPLFKPVSQLPDAPGVKEVIKKIPKATGNVEFDGMVKAFRAMRLAKTKAVFNEMEVTTYNTLKNNIMNHPALPPELRDAWVKLEETRPSSTPIEVPPHAGIEKTTRIIPHEQVDTDFIAKARAEGWEFRTLNDRGDYLFEKATKPPTVETVAAERATPAVTEPTAPFNVEEIKNPTAKVWAGIVNELDKVKAPDSAYRDILSSASKQTLRQGETWRQKVVGFIERMKSEKGELIIEKKAKPSILKDTPEGGVVLVKNGKATPEVIKKLVNEGFKFIGENETGDMRFQKTGVTGTAPVLESEVGLARPTRTTAKEIAQVGEREQLGQVQNKAKSSVVAEAFNLPRGLLASWDFSAPLRQGLPLIHKKEFWNALKPMWESWKTEAGFQASQKAIADRPLFKKRINAAGDKIPSFAEDAGLKLTDLKDLTTREEAIMSTWAESGGMFERNKWMAAHGGAEAAAAYRATVGGMVRRSNRAYVAFLNNLRADVFESLVRDGNILADLKKNTPLIRSLADFVNTATGRGSLGKLESSAVALNTGLFAPRLIASRVKMLNPAYYIMAPPQVRREAIKSLLTIAGVGNTVLLLAKMAGAEVSNDPNSSDFGKVKIGNARLDPWGGFQQYFVAANRLLRPGWAKVPGMEGINTGIAPLDVTAGFLGTGGQKTTSTTTGRSYDLWNARGPYDPTHASIIGRFARGKTNPVIGFAWGIFAGMKEMSGQPMNFTTLNPMDNAIMQRFIPIVMQDVYQIASEQPELLPLLAPAAVFGMGVQQYGRVGKY